MDPRSVPRTGDDVRGIAAAVAPRVRTSLISILEDVLAFVDNLDAVYPTMDTRQLRSASIDRSRRLLAALMEQDERATQSTKPGPSVSASCGDALRR